MLPWQLSPHATYMHVCTVTHMQHANHHIHCTLLYAPTVIPLLRKDYLPPSLSLSVPPPLPCPLFLLTTQTGRAERGVACFLACGNGVVYSRHMVQGGMIS